MTEKLKLSIVKDGKKIKVKYPNGVTVHFKDIDHFKEFANKEQDSDVLLQDILKDILITNPNLTSAVTNVTYERSIKRKVV